MPNRSRTVKWVCILYFTAVIMEFKDEGESREWDGDTDVCSNCLLVIFKSFDAINPICHLCKYLELFVQTKEIHPSKGANRKMSSVVESINHRPAKTQKQNHKCTFNYQV